MTATVRCDLCGGQHELFYYKTLCGRTPHYACGKVPVEVMNKGEPRPHIKYRYRRIPWDGVLTKAQMATMREQESKGVIKKHAKGQQRQLILTTDNEREVKSPGDNQKPNHPARRAGQD